MTSSMLQEHITTASYDSIRNFAWGLAPAVTRWVQEARRFQKRWRGTRAILPPAVIEDI